MINSVIHHLGIGVADPKAAEPFFDALLVEFLEMTMTTKADASV